MQLQDVLARARQSLIRLSPIAQSVQLFPSRLRRLCLTPFLAALSFLWAIAASAQTTPSVTLAWNSSPDGTLSGYNVYSGVASQTYTNMVSFGNVTNASLSALVPGTTYFFSVTAVDAAGLESPFSNEASYIVPTTLTNTAPIVTNSPPTTQTNSPPTTQTNSPPTTQTNSPPTTQTNSPPTTQTNSPPTTQTNSPPTTLTGPGVTLGWNPSPDPTVSGYNVYSGVASQTYTNMVSFGNVTNASLSALVPGTTYFFSVTAVDAVGLESPFSNETTYNVPTTPTNSAPILTNTPPTISKVPNQTITVNTATRPLPFWVGDSQTPAANLTVSPATSNPTLVPANNISLSSSGTNWTVTVTPAPGQTGTATISLTVCDPSLCTTTSFLLTVNPLPTIALTSPANGATFTAPATVNLSASVNANGHSISQVQFFSGTTLLGAATTAPYTFAWNNVGAGSDTLTAQAVYDAGSTVVSPAATITVNGSTNLPAPWQTADIGTVGVPGSATASSGSFTISGAGNLSGSADNFRFLYQSLSGDGEIRAQILSAQYTGSGDLVGAMIRESLTPGSTYAMMGIAPAGQYRWVRRTTTGSGSSSNRAGGASPPNVWVRLVRSGNTLYAYKSNNGSSWNSVNSCTITMAPNIYIGFAAASGSSSTLATSVLTNVTVVP